MISELNNLNIENPLDAIEEIIFFGRTNVHKSSWSSHSHTRNQ